jgi:predicted RND superfamily exporter protein
MISENLPEINKRVKELVDYYTGGNVVRFAEKINLANSQNLNRIFNIDKRIKRIPGVSKMILEAITNMLPEVNTTWLFTGRGAMLKDKASSQIDPNDIVKLLKEYNETLKTQINDKNIKISELEETIRNLDKSKKEEASSE